jgi:hypothetical protein
MADSAITFSPGEVSTYYAAQVPHLKQRPAAEWWTRGGGGRLAAG